MWKTALSGITGVPITPFDAENRVDDAELRRVVERIVRTPVGAIAVCGNTGEYAALSSAEAQRVAATAIEVSGQTFTLVGVGKDLEAARAEARHAMSRGADGIMIHDLADPYVSERGLIRYIESITSVVDGVVVVYLRRRLVSLGAIGRLVDLESVVGIKYAIPDVVAFADFVAEYGDAVVPICGLAETWAPFFWAAGARGFTSGLVNLAPRLSTTLLAALEKSDYSAVRNAWALVRPFEDLRNRNGGALNVTTIKAALHLSGLLPCPAVRPPNAELSLEEHAELEDILTGLLDYLVSGRQSGAAIGAAEGTPS